MSPSVWCSVGCSVVWYFIICTKKKKNQRIRNSSGGSIRVIPKSPKSGPVVMDNTQRRGTYTPIMESTQCLGRTQESERKRKIEVATAEAMENETSIHKKGKVETLKFSQDSRENKTRTAELMNSKAKRSKEQLNTAEELNIREEKCERKLDLELRTAEDEDLTHPRIPEVRHVAKPQDEVLGQKNVCEEKTGPALIGMTREKHDHNTPSFIESEFINIA
ncbi:hypothetical protein RB195_003763 [Necator americanus]|uniref:Uncharacterized protein n=1 Tax=Necator americanus TaxID=51031 RepID=A0ABR1DQL0_NECAM